MKNSQRIVGEDLIYMCAHLAEEFAAMSGANLLITGGAGFLGYYLVQSVLHWNQDVEEARQIRVTVCDNYVRGLPSWLLDLEGEDGVTLLRHSITNPLPGDLPDFQFIIHAAGIASPTYYRAHPLETMDANVNGLRYLLDYAARQKETHRRFEGFLFFSSSEIYGDPDPAYIPTPEHYRGNVSCTGPRACYDESKRYGETLCVTFAQQFGLPVRVARPFNNYGPGLKITDRRVLPDFARDVFAGRDIVLLSDGSPRRTFCYISDAVIGYYKVLVKGRSGEAYNIGVETPEISVLELAERVATLASNEFGYAGKVVTKASDEQVYLVDNPVRRCPVIQKARSELGYCPSVSLDDGLRRSLTWYSNHLEAVEA